jgi:hypothetical protein
MAAEYKLFTNMNSKQTIQSMMRSLGLTSHEAAILYELLKAPASHFTLSQATGINRTKVYRVAQDLERKSLVTKRVDDRGSFLVASDPNALEIPVLEQEAELISKRAVLQSLLPRLGELQALGNNAFIVQTYDGVEGLKQMCWHELKAEGELLSLGAGAIEDMIPGRYWAEKHRSLSVAAGYNVHEIINDVPVDHATFTDNAEFMRRYEYRVLDKEVVLLENQMTIYNDTVAVYHWRHDQKSGVEIINKAYAESMRQMFRLLWAMASSAK